MHQTIWFKAFILASLTLITALIILQLASAFVFRNLVVEKKSKKEIDSQQIDWNTFEEHDILFNATVMMKTREQKIHLWYFPSSREDDIPPTILFCSPSSASLPRLHKIRHLANALSCNLVMFDYRPNGSSSGIFSPTLATLTEDVMSVINWLLVEKNTQPADIILVGYSLGGLPAISVALKNTEIKRLILFNSFCSFSCIASQRFSPLLSSLMVFKDFFPDLSSQVEKIQQSVAIIYADNDEVIPRKCTERMIKSLSTGTSRMEIEISGTHSSIKIEKAKVYQLRGFLGIKDEDNDDVVERAIRLFNDDQKTDL